MASIILDFINQSFTLDILDTLIPFVIVYTLLYTLLQRANIFQNNRGANAIVSLGITSLVVFNPIFPLLHIFQQLFSSTVVLMIFLIIFVSIVLVLGYARGGDGKRETWLLLVSAILAYFVLIKSDVLGRVGFSIESLNIPSSVFVLFGVLAVILVIVKYAE